MASEQTHNDPNILKIALLGMIALVIAMGIGRFSFTPILPMMQNDGSLNLSLGGWLASINYLGYLIGGMTARRLMSNPVLLVKSALLLVVGTNTAMGLTAQYEVWLMLRIVCGAASAWVMVGISSLCMPALSQSPRLASLVYTGVGNGISLTGIICLVLVIIDASANTAWIMTAVAAALLGMSIWHVFSDKRFTQAAKGNGAKASAPRSGGTITSEQWILIWSYGISGFGYIIPATFLPAQAREILGDTPLFGLAWPVFGMASAAMVFFAGVLAARWGRIRVWMIAHIVMAIGVITPAVWPGLTGILLSALCVGGTFVAVTLIAMQHAQAVSKSEAPTMMARLTTAYAAGQILGPILISMLDTNAHLAIWACSFTLILSSWMLSRLKPHG